jgi:multidrug efflux pump subunit AcrA (membrane-fusion protein)
VVGAKDLVESRPVTVGALQGGAWVIQSGLTAGERVVVDGLQKAVPGRPVKPVLAKASPPAVPVAGDTARPAQPTR